MLILRPGETEENLFSRGVSIYRPHGISALYNSLLAFWKLDEVSGNRADSIGANTLVDNNTVTSNTGIVYPLAAEFLIANSERLTIVDNVALSISNINFWLAAWVRPDAIANGMIIGKASADSTAGFEYALYLYSTGEVGFITSDGATFSAVKSGAGTIAVSTQYLVVGYHNSATSKIGISVNGGAAIEATRTQTPTNTTKGFAVGGVGASFCSMRCGPAMFGKSYLINAGDLAYLYNSGLGRTLEAMKDY